MGRASRWLRGLLGGKRAPPPPALPADDSHPVPSSKDKQRWGFVKSFREKEPPPLRAAAAAPPEERTRSYRAPARGFEAVDEEEQSKRAIAVAAATAAVAEAAVAAAQAAAAVVRLTSGGRSVPGGGRREVWAAVKIQSSFRGYLARRALRALKGLVKLQALVRGNIVRKQAAETLRCMQALVRVQARARACRAIRSERSKASSSSRAHPRKPDPPIRPLSKALKRNPSNRDRAHKHPSSDTVDSDRAQSSGWNWLDRWMEERYWDTRESARKASLNSAMEDERNDKILEIDTGGKPLRRGSSSNHVQSSSSTLTSDHNSLSSSTVQQSLPSPSSADMRRRCLSPLAGEFADSPQFLSATSSRPRGPFTPAKSECSRSVFSGYSDYPNYMSNTQSSKAKVRSQSAPRQRPELEKAGLLKRAPSPARKESPATAALRAKFANKAYPGSGRLDRLGMPLAH